MARDILPTENPRRDGIVLRAEWRLNESGASHVGRQFKHARRHIGLFGAGERGVQVITLPPGGEIIVTGPPAQAEVPTTSPILISTHPVPTTSVPSPTTSRAPASTFQNIPTSTPTTQRESSTEASEDTSFTGSSISTPLMNNEAVTNAIPSATRTVAPTGMSGAAGIPIPTNTNPSDAPNTISQSAPQSNSTRLADSDSQTFANPRSSQTTSSDSSHQTGGIGAASDSHSPTESNRIIIIIGCLILGALILGGTLVLIWRWRRKASRALPNNEQVQTQVHSFNVAPSEGLIPRKHTELPILVTLPYSRPSISTVSEYRVSDYQVHTPQGQNSPSTDLGHLYHIRDRLHHIRGLVSSGETDSQASVVEIDRMIDDLPDSRPPEYASLHSGRGSSYYVVSHPHV